VGIVVLELAGLTALGFSLDEIVRDIALFEGMCLGFGGWLCLFAKETLPDYYDKHKVRTYSDGIFRMNMAGIRFNNSNWRHILRAGYTSLLTVSVVFPLLYFLVQRFFPAFWETGPRVLAYSYRRWLPGSAMNSPRLRRLYLFSCSSPGKKPAVSRNGGFIAFVQSRRARRLPASGRGVAIASGAAPLYR
jgi:hypothetical protein